MIDLEGVQYDYSYRSTFESGELREGAFRRGYLLFDGVPEDAEIAKIVIDRFVFDLTADRGYTLAQKAEEDYQNSAVEIGNTEVKGYFEVTAEKAGFFADVGYDEETYFRIDLSYKNIGSEPEYSGTSMFLLDQRGNQYGESYGGTLDSFGQVYPGVTQSGYVLFEGVPSTVTLLNLVFQLGRDGNFNAYEFSFSINFLR